MRLCPVSTQHLSCDAAAFLAREEVAVHHDHGWIVYGARSAPDTPVDLLIILALSGSWWINFDDAAPLRKGLPVFPPAEETLTCPTAK